MGLDETVEADVEKLYFSIVPSLSPIQKLLATSRLNLPYKKRCPDAACGITGYTMGELPYSSLKPFHCFLLIELLFTISNQLRCASRIPGNRGQSFETPQLVIGAILDLCR